MKKFLFLILTIFGFSGCALEKQFPINTPVTYDDDNYRIVGYVCEHNHVSNVYSWCGDKKIMLVVAKSTLIRHDGNRPVYEWTIHHLTKEEIKKIK